MFPAKMFLARVICGEPLTATRRRKKSFGATVVLFAAKF